MAALSPLTATGAHDMVCPVWWQSWCSYCSGGDDCVVSEVVCQMWNKNAVEETPSDIGVSLGKGMGWSVNVQIRSWNMGQLWKLNNVINLNNVFMAGRNRLLQGVPVPVNSSESGRSSGPPRFLSAMWWYKGPLCLLLWQHSALVMSVSICTDTDNAI